MEESLQQARPMTPCTFHWHYSNTSKFTLAQIVRLHFLDWEVSLKDNICNSFYNITWTRLTVDFLIASLSYDTHAGSTDETVRTWSIDMTSSVRCSIPDCTLKVKSALKAKAKLYISYQKLWGSQGRDKRDSELQLGREANALVWHPTHADQLATSAADNLIKFVASLIPSCNTYMSQLMNDVK